jgi:hypothetical protein
MGIFSKNEREDIVQALDPERLEAEIRATMPISQATRRLMLEQPQITAEDLGRITAEAVKKSHDETAKAITDLGIKAAARVDRLNQIKIEADALAAACLDLAAKYRAKGEAEADIIERTARENNEARDIVEAMVKKIEQPDDKTDETKTNDETSIEQPGAKKFLR